MDRNRKEGAGMTGLAIQRRSVGLCGATAALFLVLGHAPAASQSAAPSGQFTFFGVGDWDHDGRLDLVGRNAAGDLMLYAGEGSRGYSQTQPIKIGNGWNGFSFFGMGDWDHDGHVDLVARNPAGDLMLYPGESRRGYSQTQPVKIGNGWNGFSFFGMGDWDHDGQLDLVARNTAGDLMLYPGEGS